ncbi:MAG: hypothetical protein Q4C87_11355 [Actinomycetaceae bacterium]|nr:hypothetical protein [Actinomycetaceae bacterium]
MTSRTLRPSDTQSGLRHVFRALTPSRRGTRVVEDDTGMDSTCESDADLLGSSPLRTSEAGSGVGAPPSSILLIDPELDTVTKQCARRVAAMVGARVVDSPNGLEWGGEAPPGASGLGGQQAPQAHRLAGRPYLALVATWQRANDMRGAGVCAVLAGASGQICLPGDEEILASALVHTAGIQVEGVRSRVLAVADCGLPDVGRDLALRLAQVRAATLIDLLGCGPGHLPIGRDDGVRWADLDTRESAFPPHLQELLPQVGSVRVLGADARGGAYGNAPHLHAVLRAIAGDSVLDLGHWDDRAQQASAYADHTFLICDSGERSAEQVCGAVATWPPASATTILTMRRPWVGLSAVLGDLPGDVRVRTLRGRGGRAVKGLWAVAEGDLGGGAAGEQKGRQRRRRERAESRHLQGLSGRVRGPWHVVGAWS